MTSTIKVNNIQNQCGANIINESSNTITIGASGDTVTLASGASQTGFGRTGTVNWDTTKKTAGFTGVSGNGYFIDTTSGAITVNLPASPSAGDIMALADYAGTAGTNAITVGRNGSNIEGLADNAIININRESKTLVFVDATQGWLPVNDNADPISDSKFVTASGGTETTVCTNFKVHTFTGPGTFTVSCAGNAVGSNTVDYMVIAGGGAGGFAPSNSGGGGGAGGYRESSGAASGCYTASPLGACVSALPVTASAFPITVGAGGTTTPGAGNSGSNSIFSTITSAGGGGGGAQSTPVVNGVAGGSGGGSSYCGSGSTGGAGNTPPVSPPQGNPGGNNGPGPNAAGSGGGGASAAGTPADQSTSGPGTSGPGGNGVTTSINASPVTRAGGGGGKSLTGTGSGGSGGGGAAGAAGTTNTGGGGGGGNTSAGTVPASSAGAGGSGIVVIRYKFQ